MVPTWAISFLPLVAVEGRFSSATTVSTAWSIPRLMLIGLTPAVTDFRPSRKIACARTVAVVVPSPAMSEVFDATSLSIWAPMFSTASSSSISLATVTPSLVTVGEPNFLSRTTFRPFGPSVTLTASASWSMPRLSPERAEALNFSSLAIVRCLLELIDAAFYGRIRLDGRQDVALAQDQELLAVHRDFG